MKKLKFLLLGLLTASLAGALAACSQDPQTYTFTFDTRGGTQIEPLELKEGEAVARPSDPTKQMFTFNDWYTDTTYSQVYSFGTMPAQDVTIPRTVSPPFARGRMSAGSTASNAEATRFTAARKSISARISPCPRR